MKKIKIKKALPYVIGAVIGAGLVIGIAALMYDRDSDSDDGSDAIDVDELAKEIEQLDDGEVLVVNF